MIVLLKMRCRDVQGNRHDLAGSQPGLFDRPHHEFRRQAVAGEAGAVAAFIADQSAFVALIG